MNAKTGFVIAGAPAKQPILDFRRHEGRRTPASQVALGLNVVVRVETNGRHALGRWESADNGWRSAISTYHAGVWTAKILEQPNDAACAALYLGGPCRIRTHRLDRDERVQIGENAWDQSMDLVAQRHGPEPTVATITWWRPLLGGRDPDCLIRRADASLGGQQRGP